MFGYPNLVRFSWATTKELLVVGKEDKNNGKDKRNSSNGGKASGKNNNVIAVKWLCEEDSDTAGCPDISSFFGSANSKIMIFSIFINLTDILIIRTSFVSYHLLDSNVKKQKRSHFFTKRKLQRLTWQTFQ